MRIFCLIAFTFLVALFLEIIPFPNWAIWFRPTFVLLTLSFWVLVFPNLVGMAVAFCLGWVMDLLMGSLLGTHAVVFIVLTYVLIRFNVRIRLMLLWQQTLVVFIGVLFNQTFLSWVSGLSGAFRADVWFWLPALTSAVIWPWVYTLLKSYTKRFKLYRF